jgi:hypothetical protein
MRPLYTYFKDFPKLKPYLEEQLKQEHGRIEKLIYSFIRIDYSSTLKKNKKGEAGLIILDYLNEAMAMIANYAGIFLLS